MLFTVSSSFILIMCCFYHFHSVSSWPVVQRCRVPVQFSIVTARLKEHVCSALWVQVCAAGAWVFFSQWLPFSSLGLCMYGCRCAQRASSAVSWAHGKGRMNLYCFLTPLFKGPVASVCPERKWKMGFESFLKGAYINQHWNQQLASHSGLGFKIFCPYPPPALISMTAGTG